MGFLTRSIGARRGWETRRINELRQRAMSTLTEIARANHYLLPNIAPLAEGGFGLSYELGKGERHLKFESREQAKDFVVSLFSCA